jgi:sporulation protein YlmC with PRC-barrel domain
MRTSVIAAVSALALFAAPSLAQTTSPGAAPRTPGASMPAPQKQPQPDPMKQEDVSQIKGAAVYGSDDKKIGSIDTVLMKPETKQIDRLVVGAGGVLGVGAHDVALPVDQFHWDAEKGGFKIAKTEADLKAMPAWQAPGTSTASGAPPAPSSGSSAAPSTTR